MVLGNPFFINHDVGIYPSKNILNFPSISMQVNEIKLKNGKRKNVKSQKYKMKTTQKYTLRPQEQIVVSVTFTDGNTNMANLTGTVVPNSKLIWTPLFLLIYLQSLQTILQRCSF